MLALPFALGMQAQTTVEGEATLGGGYGDCFPYEGGINLKVNTEKLTIKPYFNIKGITPYSSDKLTSFNFTYTRTGNQYSQEREQKAKGYCMGFGTELQYRLDDRNALQAAVEGSYSDRRVRGVTSEYLYAANGMPLSSVKSVATTPPLNTLDMKVQASYLHKTKRRGESLRLKYDYSLTDDEDYSLQEITEAMGFNEFLLNQITSDINIQRHEVLFDWTRPLAEGQVLNMGLQYSNNYIHTKEAQYLDDFEFNNSVFRHRTQTGAVFAGYSLKKKNAEADVRVEYDYTRMQEKNLNDVIPRARFVYHINDRNTLTANYAMRIVRPTLEFLYDYKVKGPYTLDFGNEELTGTHINKVSLAYELKTRKVDFTTTLAHTNVTDGFNAIWMEVEDIRVSTWGNEGVRKACELTPEVLWRLTERTKLRGAFTALWDERIAYAINMKNPHWGFTGRAGWEQELPWEVKLGVNGMISKGNTIDLYSHEGLNYAFGANLERSFLNKKLTASLAYEYRKLPITVITQGAYTGSIYTRNHNRNMVKVALTYQF